MLTRIAGGLVVDPTEALSSTVRDLYLRDGVIIDPPSPSERIDHDYRVEGHLVMAGGVDLHTHIGGGKVNLARLLLPERQRVDMAHSLVTAPLSSPVPGTVETGRRYLAMDTRPVSSQPYCRQRASCASGNGRHPLA